MLKNLASLLFAVNALNRDDKDEKERRVLEPGAGRETSVFGEY